MHALKYILFILQSHEKTFNCNVCGSSFGKKDVLAKHKKTHENENKAVIQHHQPKSKE